MGNDDGQYKGDMDEWLCVSMDYLDGSVKTMPLEAALIGETEDESKNTKEL